MTRYYLGRPVEAEAQIIDGWQWAVWPDGKRYKHWAAQLKKERWG